MASKKIAARVANVLKHGHQPTRHLVELQAILLEPHAQIRAALVQHGADVGVRKRGGKLNTYTVKPKGGK